MSHVEKVAIEDITDLDAFEKACQEMGVTFCRGQKTWRWFGQWMNDYAADNAAYKHGIDPKDYGKCEHAIKVPGSNYEVGLMRTSDGRLVPVFDHYGSNGNAIKRKLGTNLGLLVQRYGVEVTKKTMKRRGWRISETKDAQGEVRLRCFR